MQATQRLSRPARRPWLPYDFWGQFVSHVILLFMALLSVFPFIWMTFASFKTFKDLVSSTQMLPEVWTFNNYIEIASRINFPVAFLNSTIAATTVTFSPPFRRVRRVLPMRPLFSSITALAASSTTWVER